MDKNTGNGAAKTVQKGGLSQKEQKELVGKTAVDRLMEKGLIRSGMKIGLGTGSTAIVAVRRLAELLHGGALSGIRAVVTSFQTGIACEEYGIPVFTLNSKEIGGTLDLAIDGADEIDPENNLIKGGGAAHVQEKIVEYNSKAWLSLPTKANLYRIWERAFRFRWKLSPPHAFPLSAKCKSWAHPAFYAPAREKTGRLSRTTATKSSTARGPCGMTAVRR